MNALTETEKAYLAGLIDGEGCINIQRYQGKKNKNPSYRLQLIIAQNDTPYLSKWRDRVGVGSIYSSDSGKCSWNISSKEAAAFLKIVLPYLDIKLAEANAAIEFQDGINGHGHGNQYTISRTELIDREHYYELLRSLKKGKSGQRGRPKTTPIKINATRQKLF